MLGLPLYCATRALLAVSPVAALALAAPAAADPPAQAASEQGAPAAADPQKPKPQLGPRKSPRVLCGCPTARFLERAATGGTVPVWLHDGAHVDTFVRDSARPDRLLASEVPPTVEELPVAGEPVPSQSRLARVRAPEGFGGFLGILRTSETLPKDVLDLSKGAPAASKAPLAPRLRALWLKPLEARERPGCGAYLTHLVAWEPAEGAAELAALLVRDVATGATALVDVRFAGVYGLGRIDVCEQGIPLAAGAAATIEVRPVSSSLAIGEAWSFASDGNGVVAPARAAVPPEADRDRIEDPFPIPGADDGRSPTLKVISVAVMGVAVSGAAVAALFAWVIIPIRRRRMKDVRCAACGKDIPIDTLDDKTDGFFCPSCGAAGFWKGKHGAEVGVHKL